MKPKDARSDVLLALARMASPDGLAWPTVEMVARRANRSPRIVSRILLELEKAGEIEIQKRGRSAVYRMKRKGTE